MVVDMEKRFVELAHTIVYCTAATTDRLGRPRSRITHPVWELPVGGGLVGWLTTRSATPKTAQLRHNPYLSCSYWRENHDVAVAECAATIVTDPAERERVWAFLAATPPPVGFDPVALYGVGPQDPKMTLVRMDPWLLRFASGAALAASGGVPEVHRIP